MARPGLAASRGVDIIEFLSFFPDRGFTLSEIVRATEINVASCYAILNRLTDRGFLIRDPDQKTYTLGPSLIAIGQAAFKSQPMVARARDAAQALANELDVPVLLSTIVGDEILAVISLEDSGGRTAGMWVGERLPLVPPLGAPFLAWASEERVVKWIANRASPPSPKLVAEWRHDLEVTRERGYQVSLRPNSSPSTASLLAEMASNRHGAELRSELARALDTVDYHKVQPDKIEPDALYDVVLIASPLFDRNGEATFNLGIGGFPQQITGARLVEYGERLMRSCLEVMRADRAQPRRIDRDVGVDASGSGQKATKTRRRRATAG